MCLLPLENRAWSIAAPPPQFTHVVKHSPFMAVNLVLEKHHNLYLLLNDKLSGRCYVVRPLCRPEQLVPRRQIVLFPSK